MAFDDIRLPDDVEKGAVGGPTFQTTVTTFVAGREQRNANWPSQRCRYDISYGIDTKSKFSAVLRFFYARQGKARGFRFKDWSDFESDVEELGTGDGTNKDFQLVKNYTSLLTYQRKITRPIVGTIVVYKDGVVATGWSLLPLGLIRFDTAPTAGVVVSAEFEFDVPVRFNKDEMRVNLEIFDAGGIEAIELVEIRE
jgi:uncharacterized protein (TIGR02217 family)